MRRRARSLPDPRAVFTGAALLLISVCVIIIRSAGYTRNPEIAAWGVTFDLCISLPALFYFLVVRTGRARPSAMIPAFVIGALAARFIVPAAQQMFLHDLRLAVAPLELVIVAMIASRVVRLRRTLRADSTLVDGADVIALASREIFGRGRAADVVASEISVLYYGLFCWRRRSPDDRGFTSYRLAGWGTVLGALILMIVAEGIGAHLLLQMWSSAAAWTLTALDIYSILWLLGDYQALRLRPTHCTNEGIAIRLGLRWTVDIPWSSILTADRHAPEQPKSPTHLKIGMLERPQFLLRLREPVEASGIFGIKREISTIEILVDEPERFDAAIRQHLGASDSGS